MAREGKPDRVLRDGIQPFVEQGETLQYATLGTNKSTLGMQVMFGGLGKLAGELGNIGSVVEGALGGIVDGAGEGKKTYLIGLTDRRLLVAEVLKWGFDFLLRLWVPIPGPIKQTGPVRSIALSDVKWLNHEKKGSFESTLYINLPAGTASIAFENLYWVGRATELAKRMEAARQGKH